VQTERFLGVAALFFGVKTPIAVITTIMPDTSRYHIPHGCHLFSRQFNVGLDSALGFPEKLADATPDDEGASVSDLLKRVQ